jgi:serine/threonine protein kinase
MIVKICDFGCAAKLSNPDELRKTICGTPSFMAPEVAKGVHEPHSFEADLWSLGCILFTLFVGKSPFEGADIEEIIKHSRKREYDYPDHSTIS